MNEHCFYTLLFSFMHVGYIGTLCPARHVVTLQQDGTVSVKFYGHHNHGCQQEYCVNFVNSIGACDRFRHLVDVKLIAGMTDCGKIQRSITGDIVEIGKQNGGEDNDSERSMMLK